MRLLSHFLGNAAVFLLVMNCDLYGPREPDIRLAIMMTLITFMFSCTCYAVKRR